MRASPFASCSHRLDLIRISSKPLTAALLRDGLCSREKCDHYSGVHARCPDLQQIASSHNQIRCLLHACRERLHFLRCSCHTF